MARVRADKLREAQRRPRRHLGGAPRPGADRARGLRPAHARAQPARHAARRRQRRLHDLLQVPEGQITEAGLRGNISVGVQYLEAWLRGNGCVPLYNLMEDAATAEISPRADVAVAAPWRPHRRRPGNHRGTLRSAHDGENSTASARKSALRGSVTGFSRRAARLFEQMTKSETFDEFLTLPAYELLS